jgi:hypothetical protein
MRFKIFFNEQKQTLDINCLNDQYSDTILPTDPAQHLYFPIPNELASDIKKELMPLLEGKEARMYHDITEEIRALTDRRREMINELRMELNPKVMEVCEKFKVENAEYFI